MATTGKPGFAHRFGHAVGTVIGRFLAFEPRLARAFRRRGLPPVLVKILLWSVKLAVIAALLYVAFWVAIFVLDCSSWLPLGIVTSWLLILARIQMRTDGGLVIRTMVIIVANIGLTQAASILIEAA